MASNEVRFAGLASGIYVICDMTRADDYRVKVLMGGQTVDLFEQTQTSDTVESQDNTRAQKTVETESLTINQTVSCGERQGRVIDAAIGDMLSVSAEGRLPNNLDAYESYDYTVNFFPGKALTFTQTASSRGLTAMRGQRVITSRGRKTAVYPLPLIT